MIHRQSFSREWILKQRERYPKADPLLIERQIYAFELLGMLAASGKPFVFKGGTALLLLLPTARRLSIDVDIVGDFSLDELQTLLAGSVFIRVVEDEREPKGIPKRHFKHYYVSAIDGRETYVLLDVLYAPNGYPALKSVSIVNDLFAVETKRSVMTPTINGITGDKLTAFAPHTLGVPYGKGKSMEIIKQLFDLSELFGHLDDLSELSSSYKSIWYQESRFLDQKITLSQTLDDTIDTGLILSQAKLKGAVESTELDELLKGISQLKSYFLGTKFNIDDARVAAAKAALLAAILRSERLPAKIDEVKYAPSKIKEIETVILDGRFQILNKLKALSPEAFYYWWVISRLLP
jgi:hypothetical protein